MTICLAVAVKGELKPLYVSNVFFNNFTAVDTLGRYGNNGFLGRAERSARVY